MANESGLAFGHRQEPLLVVDFVSAPAFRQVARREFVLRRVAERAADFRADFPEWLAKNMPLWERFEREANQVWNAGRRHYSSRTLWEVMRHHTTLAELDSDFKINNNFAPDIARLYLVMYPDRPGFFETRGRT
jgi:hypothetical protein